MGFKSRNSYLIIPEYRLIQSDCWVLTTYHTQYTWDRSICILLLNRTTLRVFVTYLTGALYVQPLWSYKQDNRVRSNGDDFKGGSDSYLQFSIDRAPVRYVTKTWSVVLLNKKIQILLSQVYCVWKVVKTPTVISNNPVYTLYDCQVRNMVLVPEPNEIV